VNYMEHIAKLLGVELCEEFYLERGGKIKPSYLYKLTVDGMFVRKEGSRKWVAAPVTLVWTIRGICSIIKLPWKPKENETYYYCKFDEVDCTKYTSAHYLSKLNIKLGNCFRTMTEAEEHLDRFIDFIESEPITDWRDKND